MAGYNEITTRQNVRVLETTQKIRDEILTGVMQGSAILPLMTKLANMSSGTTVMPVMDSLPDAYWVNGDEGLKETTSAMWKDVYLYAEELAVIVPIPINVLEDSEYDIFGEYKPKIIEKMYKRVDEAIILGKGKPPRWREGIIPSIINAGASVTQGQNQSLYSAINDAMVKVEESGFDVNGILGGVDLKGKFRMMLDSTGQPIANTEIGSIPRSFVANGAWDKTKASLIVGDFKQAVYSIRKDIKFEIFDTGVLSDSEGKVIRNLLQQDLIAMRVTFRIAWALPNPVNSLAENNEERLPFAFIEPATPATTYDVTFTVTDADSNAVEGAKVTFGDQEKITDASGVAVFSTLGNTSSLYKVEKKAHNKVKGVVNVETSNVPVNVVNF